MHITFSANELRKKLAIAIRGVSNRTPLHILTHIVIKTLTDKKVQFKSTDMELSFLVEAEADVKDAGTIAVPAKLLNDIVSELSGSEIVIELKDMVVEVSDGLSKFKINVMAAEEFPFIPDVEGDPVLLYEEKNLRKLIQSCIFASADKEEVRVALTGLNIDLNEGKMRVVATDGRRAAVYETIVADAEDVKLNCIVPSRALREVVKIIEDKDTPVGIYMTEGMISFVNDSLTVQSRLLQGTFPDASKIMPSKFVTNLRIDTSGLKKVINRAIIMAQSKDTPGLISLDICEDDKIIVSSNSQDLGEFNEELSAKVEGNPLKIAFNANYITDFLMTVKEDEVMWFMNDSTAATVMRPFTKEEQDYSYNYLLMPVRLKTDHKEEE